MVDGVGKLKWVGFGVLTVARSSPAEAMERILNNIGIIEIIRMNRLRRSSLVEYGIAGSTKNSCMISNNKILDLAVRRN